MYHMQTLLITSYFEFLQSMYFLIITKVYNGKSFNTHDQAKTCDRFIRQNPVPEMAKSGLSWIVYLPTNFLHLESILRLLTLQLQRQRCSRLERFSK
jgi:hypothetical protein